MIIKHRIDRGEDPAHTPSVERMKSRTLMSIGPGQPRLMARPKAHRKRPQEPFPGPFNGDTQPTANRELCCSETWASSRAKQVVYRLGNFYTKRTTLRPTSSLRSSLMLPRGGSPTNTAPRGSHLSRKHPSEGLLKIQYKFGMQTETKLFSNSCRENRSRRHNQPAELRGSHHHHPAIVNCYPSACIPKVTVKTQKQLT